ncbi:hypothetical protein FTX61_14445 [Nitriliruptoraceae bacterium ZYF776]|nr:hypothetical protein [Profundirhabdus halotolerans]
MTSREGGAVSRSIGVNRPRRGGVRAIAGALAGALVITGLAPTQEASAAELPEPACSIGARPVAAGAAHGLLLASDGTVSATGANVAGQLGDGSTASRSVPVEVTGLPAVAGVMSDGEVSAAVTSGGELYVWGAHGLGAAGAWSPEPLQVEGLPAVRDVAIGASHVLVLTEDGTVWTWGANWYGQLGHGTTDAAHVPQQVPGIVDAISVAAGFGHSVAAMSDGSVLAWGSNWEGQLGNGQMGWGVEERSPVPVANLSTAVEVAAGADHTLALLADGTVRTWGTNGQGQLGNGSTTNSATPQLVPFVTDVKMLAASATGNHSLALGHDGTLWSWGRNAEGQVGTGALDDAVVWATQVDVEPAAVVSVGGNTSRAVTFASDHLAWGHNGSGQIGDGSTVLRPLPRQIGGVDYAAPEAPDELDAFGGEGLAYLQWERSPDTVVTQLAVVPHGTSTSFDAVTVPPAEDEAVVSPLSAGADYRFAVVAQNCVGSSDASDGSGPVVPTDVQLSAEGGSGEPLRLTDRMALEVNTFNGNLQVVGRDLAVQGTAGMDVEVVRTYNARSSETSVFGIGWSSNLAPDVRLTVGDGVVTVRSEAGDRTSFALEDDEWVTPPGAHADLETVGDEFVMTERVSGTRWGFDSGGDLVEVADRNGNTIAYLRDGAGRLTSIVDTRGRTIEIDYDGDLVAAITDPIGRTWTYDYVAGRLATVGAPDGGETAFAYGDGHLSQVTTPAGRVLDLGYDEHGRLLNYSWPQASGSPTTSFAYEERTTIVTDARGNDTVYEFDPVGRSLGVTDARGHTTATDYTAHSNVRTFRSRGGGVTNYRYANQTSVESVVAPTGMGAESRYDDPRHDYLPTRTTDPQRNHTWYEYDDVGNVVEQRNASPGDNTVEVEVADDGQRTLERNPRGAATAYNYDATGHLASVVPPDSLGTITLGYDDVSRLVEVTDGLGQATAYDYDALDRLVEVGYGDGTGVTYVYDLDGNQISMTDVTGTTTMVYDARGQLVERTTPDGLRAEYGYDAVGNIVSVRDRGGVVRYTYDEVNLPVEVTDRDGRTISMVYDANDNRSAIVYPNGVTVGRSHDSSDRLVAVDTVGLADDLSLAYDYREPTTGNPDTSLRWASTWVDGRVTDYQYDAVNRLTRARTLDEQGQVATQHAYGYDGASNRVSRAVIADGTSEVEYYAYDDADRILATTAEQFSHDAAGNMTGSTSGAVFANGESGQTWALASRTAPELVMFVEYRGPGQTERVRHFVQDLSTPGRDTAGRTDAVTLDGLVSDDRTAGCTTPAGCASVAEAAASSTTVTTEFDHTAMGVTRVTVDGTVHDYTRAPDGTILAAHGPQGAHYFLHDGLGSTLGLVDEDAELAALYRYGPFGETAAEIGEEVFNPWRFTGAYQDPTGLYHIGERYYDPDLGRWTQQDPVVDALDPQQWNRYVYVGNDPVNHIDPTGMVSMRCVVLKTLGVAPPQSFIDALNPVNAWRAFTHQGPVRGGWSGPPRPAGPGWEFDLLPAIKGQAVSSALTAVAKRFVTVSGRVVSVAGNVASLGYNAYQCR